MGGVAPVCRCTTVSSDSWSGGIHAERRHVVSPGY